MLEDRIHGPRLLEKVITAEQAAALIQPGMTLGFSGFTAVGYPKAIPLAIAAAGKATNLHVIAGASAGDELDGALARAGLIARRTPFNISRDLREQINDGTVQFHDEHLDHLPQLVKGGTLGRVDFAILECCVVLEDGGIVPTLSVGANDTLAAYSDRILLELNLSHPVSLLGIHDIYTVGKLPHRDCLPILDVSDRIGTNVIPCPIEKIAGIVISDMEDQEPRFFPPDEVSSAIAANIIELLKSEIAVGRLPRDFVFQSGFGSVGNAVLYGLGNSDFGRLRMFTEVIQDSALQLLINGKIESVSATSLSLSKSGRRLFYKHLEQLQDRVVIRPQDISNDAGIIRRLGVVAMNTAIEADLYGNVNSTHIAGSGMMNGIGGSADFARNALISIFITPSIAKKGAISSLVPMVSHVDHPEHDVDVLVTEYGYADLRGHSPRERAELIIENCSHPLYRPLLRDYFERAKSATSAQHTPHLLDEALSWHLRYLKTGSMLP